MNSIEIYFSDLNEEAQKEVLKLYGIKKVEDGNLDIIPLCVLEVEE